MTLHSTSIAGSITGAVTRFALGAAVGGAAAYLLPRGEDSREPAEPLDLTTHERAVVVSGCAMDRWGLVTLGAGTGMQIAQAAHTRTVKDIVGAVLVTALTAASRRIDVLVDARGITVTCGVPGVRHTIPTSSIRSARAVTVTAAEFGGLGLRYTPERGWAVVLRDGPALTLDLDLGPLTITTDDPETAASLIAHHLTSTR